MFNVLRRFWLVLLVLVVALLGLSGYLYKQNRDSRQELESLKTDPQKAARESNKAITDMVGKIVVLPEGEDPTVATVTDPEKLKDQPFFSKAQKDDRVLIYTKAQKAILYNPSSNKVVEIAAFNIGATASPKPSASPSR